MDTFEDYCRDRWDMTRDYAYKLIGSSEVIKNLENVKPEQLFRFYHKQNSKPAHLPGYPHHFK